MRSTTKALFVGLIAALALVSGLSTASARRIELSFQRFLAVWEPLTFTASGGIVNPVVKCRVTLEGSFHSRTLSKVVGQLVGYITEVNVTRPCTENSAFALNGTERLPNGSTARNTLPWHVRYSSFSGTLPRITAIVGASTNGAFLTEAFGASCTYESTSGSPFTGTINVEAAGAATSLAAGGTVPLLEGPGACPPRGALSGATIRLGRQPEANEREYRPITVRLVQ